MHQCLPFANEGTEAQRSSKTPSLDLDYVEWGGIEDDGKVELPSWENFQAWHHGNLSI